MSAKILASMKRIDASLTLIAGKFANGEYDTVEALKGAQANVQNALASAKSAFTVAAKPATKGRKGIVAMATEAYDTLLGAITQAEVKANLLNQAISADLVDMEQSLIDAEPTEEIPLEDFSASDDPADLHQEFVPEQDDAAVEAEDNPEIQDEVIPEQEEVPVEQEEEVDLPAGTEAGDDELPETDVDLPAVEQEEELDAGAELDALMEEEEETDQLDEEFAPAGTLDGALVDFSDNPALDEIDEDDFVPDVVDAKKKKAALKATLSKTAHKKSAVPADLWDFKS